ATPVARRSVRGSASDAVCDGLDEEPVVVQLPTQDGEGRLELGPLRGKEPALELPGGMRAVHEADRPELAAGKRGVDPGWSPSRVDQEQSQERSVEVGVSVSSMRGPPGDGQCGSGSAPCAMRC